MYYNMHRRKKPGNDGQDGRYAGPTLGPAEGIPEKILDAAHLATCPVTANDGLTGSVLSGRYKILEKIGEGGMGRIYLAEDERLGKRVVVKMLPPVFAGKVELAERFVQEAKLTSRIEQENIVSITDLVVTAPPFYVMEHLRGTELGALLHTEGRLQWDERTRDMLAQICRALGAAHEQGIVHRDMKPENVFLVEHSDGRQFVKILDFGIAKLLSESAVEPKAIESREELGSARTGRNMLTNIGTVMGTPHYMSPEQGQGGIIDNRSDIYAVGVIMYELLTGQVPFDIPGRTGMGFEAAGKIVEMHITEPVVPPRERRPEADIPEDIEAVIMTALRKDPKERFADIRDMGAAISRCAAPAYRPKVRVITDDSAAANDSRSMEGLIRIRQEEASRRKSARVTGLIIAGAIAVAAAGGAAFGINRAFQGRPPAVDAIGSPMANDAASAHAGNARTDGAGGGGTMPAAIETERPAGGPDGGEGRPDGSGMTFTKE